MIRAFKKIRSLRKRKKGDALAWLANPPKEAFFIHQGESSVDIIRKDREE